MSLEALDYKVVSERFLDFSVRIAEKGFPNITDKRRERLSKEVRSFLEYLIDFCEREEEDEGDILEGWDGGQIEAHMIEYFEQDGFWIETREGVKEGKFYNMLQCCVRAGIDAALNYFKGGGVLGFNLGDLRKMYDKEIPQWLQEGLVKIHQNLNIQESEDAYPLWL